MTPSELLAACKQFEASRSSDTGNRVTVFATIVQNSFGVLGLYQRDLADDFEVAESTVSRWGTGLAKPHPQIQRSVIAWIGKRAAKLVKELPENHPPQELAVASSNGP